MDLSTPRKVLLIWSRPPSSDTIVLSCTASTDANLIESLFIIANKQKAVLLARIYPIDSVVSYFSKNRMVLERLRVVSKCFLSHNPLDFELR